MDQLKEILGVLKRQHFWILAPVLLALGITGGMMASKKLSSDFDTNKGKVNNYLREMQGVSGTPQHPNRDFQSGMEDLIRNRRDNVQTAWASKWEGQKKELKWPERLPADFRNQVDNLRPIEKVDPTNNATQRIPTSLRRAYGGFIKKELPLLAGKIGARWQPASKGGRNRGDFGGFRETTTSREPRSGDVGEDAVDESQIVVWDPENQALIDERFDWGTKPPSTFEVLYAQEDLWVIATLIDIIKRTNVDARTHSQAAVKEIKFMRIGKDVEPSTFTVIPPSPLGTEASEDYENDVQGNMPETSGNGEVAFDENGEMIDGSASPGPLAELVANRYFDENYQPIQDLASFQANVTIAKRIPVRLRMTVDQRYVNRLLVECANSPLTFEVRQLRFNPKTDDFVRGGGASGRENARFGRSSTEIKELQNYDSFDRTIELFGIVYIFNPVDDGVLGIGSDADLTATTGSAIQR